MQAVRSSVPATRGVGMRLDIAPLTIVVMGSFAVGLPVANASPGQVRHEK